MDLKFSTRPCDGAPISSMSKPHTPPHTTTSHAPHVSVRLSAWPGFQTGTPSPLAAETRSGKSAVHFAHRLHLRCDVVVAGYGTDFSSVGPICIRIALTSPFHLHSHSCIYDLRCCGHLGSYVGSALRSPCKAVEFSKSGRFLWAGYSDSKVRGAYPWHAKCIDHSYYALAPRA